LAALVEPLLIVRELSRKLGDDGMR
jgi:hypothetical protein